MGGGKRVEARHLLQLLESQLTSKVPPYEEVPFWRKVLRIRKVPPRRAVAAARTPVLALTLPLEEVRTLFSHQDQVTRLPESADLLGGNDHCPHGFYTVGNHFLSIQAHPEYSPDYVRALTEIRRGIIPEPILEAGLTSLDQPHHQHELAQWIQNFLMQ